VRPKAGRYNQPIGCSAQGGETHRPYSKRRNRRKKEGRSFGFLVINVCNHGEHYETPCTSSPVHPLLFDRPHKDMAKNTN
jgi:hypothetical protein